MGDRRVIRVTGKGTIKVKPDVTRISVTLTGCYREYGETLKRSAEDTEALKDLLEKLGFERGEVRTLSFNVNTKNESYQDRDRNWKQRFVGYEFRHILKVEFDSDNERLGKVLYALANDKGIQPEFRLSYTVKDPEASKNLLLGRAVEDAKAKAEVLSRAAGVELKVIESIDYSWGEITFETSPMRNEMLMKCGDAEACYDESYAMDVEPDDIEASDTVTVVWSIG